MRYEVLYDCIYVGDTLRYKGDIVETDIVLSPTQAIPLDPPAPELKQGTLHVNRRSKQN